MIEDECFLCEKKRWSKSLCKKHYAEAYRLVKKQEPIDLAIDVLVMRVAVERAHKKLMPGKGDVIYV